VKTLFFDVDQDHAISTQELQFYDEMRRSLSSPDHHSAASFPTIKPRISTLQYVAVHHVWSYRSSRDLA